MSDHCEDTPSRPVLCKLSFSYVLEAELLAHRTLPSPPRRLYTPYTVRTPWPDARPVSGHCRTLSLSCFQTVTDVSQSSDMLGRMTQGFERRFDVEAVCV